MQRTSHTPTLRALYFVLYLLCPTCSFIQYSQTCIPSSSKYIGSILCICLTRLMWVHDSYHAFASPYPTPTSPSCFPLYLSHSFLRPSFLLRISFPKIDHILSCAFSLCFGLKLLSRLVSSGHPTRTSQTPNLLVFLEGWGFDPSLVRRAIPFLEHVACTKHLPVSGGQPRFPGSSGTMCLNPTTMLISGMP